MEGKIDSKTGRTFNDKMVATLYEDVASVSPCNAVMVYTVQAEYRF